MDRPRLPVNAGRQPRAARRRGRATLTFGALLLLAPLPGCSLFEAPVIQRGHRVTEDRLKEITPGVQTRADVQALLGSPTATSTFSDESWYYISSKTRQRPGRHLLVTDQQTVAVDFDPRGVVRGVRVLTDADGREVDMVERETPSPGTERTLLQALFGNIGRFGPGPTGQTLGPTPAGTPAGR